MSPLQRDLWYPGEVALAAGIQRFCSVAAARHASIPARIPQIPAAGQRRPAGLRDRSQHAPTLARGPRCHRANLTLHHSPSSAALRKLWGDKDYSTEVEEMLEEKAALEGVRSHSVLELIQNQSLRWQLLTILVGFTALQLCGINAVSHVKRPRNSADEMHQEEAELFQTTNLVYARVAV